MIPQNGWPSLKHLRGKLVAHEDIAVQVHAGRQARCSQHLFIRSYHLVAVFGQVQIGSADAAGLDRDEHLPLARSGFRRSPATPFARRAVQQLA